MPVNDESLDFGQVAVGGAGTSWLVLKGRNFTSPLSVRSGGTDKDAFILSTRSIPASAINKTGEYMLTIQFKPTRTGHHEASLSIYDGGLAGSIRVNLTGEGCPVPELTRLTAMQPVDVTDHAYTACWGAAPEVVDYYVVTRTKYTSTEQDAEQLESDTNTLRIEGRDPAVMETYSVRSSRLGYLSEASNTITVDASGVDGIYAGTGYMIVAPVDGGFRILSDCVSGTVTVFDTTGRALMQIDNPAHGEIVALPAGIYIVAGDKIRKPSKLIVK